LPSRATANSFSSTLRFDEKMNINKSGEGIVKAENIYLVTKNREIKKNKMKMMLTI
jgi:hypothetical protein